MTTRRVLRGLARGLVAVVGVAVAAVLVWLRPFAADPSALAVLDDLRAADGTVELRTSPTRLELLPRDEETVSGVGLVFQPGARVDHRAYVRLLEPLAAAGHLVVVVPQPFGIGFTAAGAPADVVAEHPEVQRWVVAGHSLGGVVASSAAADGARSAGGSIDGLLLWASYPLGDLSGSDLAVTSVSGTADGLSTPDDIAASRADLPPDTRFVAVDGATHAFFGDYGDQPGDGEPGVPREVAQEQVTAASLELLELLRTP